MTIGEHVSPTGRPDRHGIIVALVDGIPDYVTVLWDAGVVAEGTPNPIEEYIGDLQPNLRG